ncbi:MAG: TonB-dependent receptor, partial [Bacteroidota bacterium]
LLTNSGIGLPTDLWVSSTDRVAPQSSTQVALGVVKDISAGISVSIEGYIKKSTNVIAYKEGASFLILDELESSESISWEDNITTGKADAFGIELFLEKKIGDFTGWFGYTLSKTELQFDELNFGRKFLARYDRRHDVSLVGIYSISDRITLSGTWVYGTGNNLSLPVRTHRTASDFLVENSFLFNSSFNDIDQRNNFRAEAYHRLDLSIRMTKQKKKGRRTWELSLYNAYSRKNPFFYYQFSELNTNGTEIGKLKRVTLFPLLPSFRYTFEF